MHYFVVDIHYELFILFLLSISLKRASKLCLSVRSVNVCFSTQITFCLYVHSLSISLSFVHSHLRKSFFNFLSVCLLIFSLSICFSFFFHNWEHYCITASLSVCLLIFSMYVSLSFVLPLDSIVISLSVCLYVSPSICCLSGHILSSVCFFFHFLTSKHHNSVCLFILSQYTFLVLFLTS